MDRREFLAVSACGFLGSMLPRAMLAAADPHEPVHFGWIPPTQTRLRRSARPYLSQQVKGQFIGSGKGKRVLLYKYLARALNGTIVPHNQQGPDCIGHAFGVAVDTLAATQSLALGLREKFVAKASTEAIYGGSRIEIGVNVHNYRFIGGGSQGIFGAEYLRDYGVLVRQKYGEIDLTKYNWDYARQWGRFGLPDELEPIAKQHPVRSFALVQSYADCRDAIVNGYPVILCSNQGFNPTCDEHNPAGGRDKHGFLNACGTWNHAMAALGVDDSGDRPGLLVLNSWGDWVDGPVRYDQPVGSFWVDADIIDSMCAQGDSYTISGLIGFRSQPLDYFF